MGAIRLIGFTGENRAVEPTLLPPTTGVTSTNQKPGRGDLRPWRSPSTVASVTSGHKTIYRMGRDVDSDSQYWLSWSTVVHAIRGFDPDDTTERTYYSGDGAPKVTNNVFGLSAPPYPTTNRPLGVPAPTTQCSTNVVGGTGNDQTVYYVYTFVTDWGWESAPSPVSGEVIKKPDSTVTLGSFDTAPNGNYNITKIRIYRTQVDTTSTADFFFLREIAYGTSSTTDDGRDLGEVIATSTWEVPPSDLYGLTSLWNGMAAGITGNSVRFCEPYTLYAWPAEYEIIPPDSKPLALGAFGQNVLVLTTGRPLLLSGTSPDSMDQQPLDIPQGCVSRQSVVSMGSGVAWASEDGLCWYGAGGSRLLTAGLMTREDWQALVPSTIIGRMYEGLYFGSYSIDGGSTWKGFLISPDSPQGIYFLSTGYQAMHFDELKDQLYVLSGANVQKWDAGSSMTVTFKSKVFVVPEPTNFAWAEVRASAYPTTLKVYANNALKHTQTVANQYPFRLPSGFLAEEWQFEATGTVAVQSVTVANLIEELQQT